MKKRQHATLAIISKVMTVPEVSQFLNVSPVTVYRLLRRRQIPAFRLAANWRFDIEDLELWMENKAQKIELGGPRKP
jgi:excisionase family DNA binding protein